MSILKTNIFTVYRASIRLLSILSVVAGITLFTGVATMGSAVASTPDGLTPANEGICDPLMEATKGLYGLCVAYCEAQDLDLVDRNPPSTQILANYNRKKQDSDPTMPCVHAPCPCWTVEQFAAITIDGQAQYCDRASTASTTIFDNTSDSETELRSATSSTYDGRRLSCSYIDNNTQPITNNFQRITSEEAGICHAMVIQACDDLGL
jgi:hypothetical protein